MRKYLQLLSISWSNGFVYRTSVILWRVRNFLSSLMALTIWSVIFTGQQSTFGYSQEQMITYIFLAALLQSVIMATISHGLAQEIYSGNISKILLKPIGTWAYLATEDLADKLKNAAFVLIEMSILYLIFQPSLALPSGPALLLFLVWLLLGALLYFFIQILFGTIGFWSPDVWAPKFLFFMFLDFTAGKLYPLDILPAFIQNIVYLTPFPYLSYVQTQLFLGRLSTSEMLTHSMMLLFWTGLIGALAQFVWKRGMRDYAAAGQ